MKRVKKLFALIALLTLGVNASFAANEVSSDGYIIINTIEDFKKIIRKSGNKIRLEAKEYTIKKAGFATPVEHDTYRNGVLQDKKRIKQHLLDFSGSNNTIDMTGATINVNTELFGLFGGTELIEAIISGNDNYIKGLKLIDYGEGKPILGALNLEIAGERNTVTEAYIYAKGSVPYGYGHLFGKGAEYIYKHRKHSGLLITGVDVKLLKSYVLMHSYGHGLFLQGSVNTWIEDCVVEGLMRSTNEMLKETSGPAVEVGFRTLYHPGYIVPNEMKALSEDSYRIYASGANGRKTVGLNVINCKSIGMRTGFDISLGSADGDLNIIGCEAIGCQFGYSLNSGAVVENCKGDIKYGPILTFPYAKANNSKVELEITASESDHPYARSVEINGRNHDIKITMAEGVKSEIPIFFGESFRCDVAMFKSPNADIKNLSTSSNVKLDNQTTLPIVINDRSSSCTITTKGKVEDNGANNNISTL